MLKHARLSFAAAASFACIASLSSYAVTFQDLAAGTNESRNAEFSLLRESVDALGPQAHPAVRRLIENWRLPSPGMRASFATTSTMMILDAEYASDAPQLGTRAPAKQIYRVDFAPVLSDGNELRWDLKVFRMHSRATSSEVQPNRDAEAFEAAYTLSLVRVGASDKGAHRLVAVTRR
jgi:hypothetical protein